MINARCRLILAGGVLVLASPILIGSLTASAQQVSSSADAPFSLAEKGVRIGLGLPAEAAGPFEQVGPVRLTKTEAAQ